MRRSGRSREAHPEIGEAHPEVQEVSRDPPGGTGWVGRNARKSGRDWEVRTKVREWSVGPPGGLGKSEAHPDVRKVRETHP